MQNVQRLWESCWRTSLWNMQWHRQSEVSFHTTADSLTLLVTTLCNETNISNTHVLCRSDVLSMQCQFYSAIVYIKWSRVWSFSTQWENDQNYTLKLSYTASHSRPTSTKLWHCGKILLLQAKAIIIYGPGAVFYSIFYRCPDCSGQGTTVCDTCKGKQKLLTYIKLIVEW